MSCVCVCVCVWKWLFNLTDISKFIIISQTFYKALHHLLVSKHPIPIFTLLYRDQQWYVHSKRTTLVFTLFVTSVRFVERIVCYTSPLPSSLGLLQWRGEIWNHLCHSLSKELEMTPSKQKDNSDAKVKAKNVQERPWHGQRPRGQQNRQTGGVLTDRNSPN